MTARFPVDGYALALQQLLPRGRVWSRAQDATLTAVVNGLAGRFEDSDARAIALLADLFPATADGMLPEWQETLDLPALTGYTGNDLATMQAQVVTALTDSGGQSTSYFIGLASILGLTITISGYRTCNVDSPVDSPIYGAAWAHAWRVSATDTSKDYSALHALFERYKPAHTFIVWSVPVGFLLTEDGFYLLTESGDRLLLEF